MNYEYDDELESFDDFQDEFIESESSKGLMMFHVGCPVENFKNIHQETLLQLEESGVIVMVCWSEIPGVRAEYVKFN
jgi:hypothetical protein